MLRTLGETKSKWKLSWDIETEYSGAEHWNYFRPREGYVSYNNFSFGRRKLTCSNWEDEWGQSLFEPRFLDDKLHNFKAGLIGLFYERHENYLNWRLGFLPIYIPEMGPLS